MANHPAPLHVYNCSARWMHANNRVYRLLSVKRWLIDALRFYHIYNIQYTTISSSSIIQSGSKKARNNSRCSSIWGHARWKISSNFCTIVASFIYRPNLKSFRRSTKKKKKNIPYYMRSIRRMKVYPAELQKRQLSNVYSYTYNMPLYIIDITANYTGVIVCNSNLVNIKVNSHIE